MTKAEFPQEEKGWHNRSPLSDKGTNDDKLQNLDNVLDISILDNHISLSYAGRFLELNIWLEI